MAAKKSVLVLAHRMDLGGTEKALIAFLKSLLSRDVDVHLLLMEDGGVLFPFLPEGVKVRVIPGFDKMASWVYEPPIKMIKACFRSGKYVEMLSRLWSYGKVRIFDDWSINYRTALKGFSTSYDYDVAIAYSGHIDFLTYFLIKQVQAPKKYIWQHFDTSFISPNRRFGARYYKYIDRIFVVSDQVGQQFLKSFPMYRDKVSVFYNILLREELHALAKEGSSYVDAGDGVKVLTIGRLAPVKGQMMLPEIVHRMVQEGLRFRWYLLGDGAQKPLISDAIRELGIEDYLILLGEQVNPYGYLRDCDLYVQPSYYEGCCISVQEAKLFDRPVVMTDVTSARDQVQDGEDGFVVPIDPEAIYQGVRKLVVDAALRSRFARSLKVKDTGQEIDRLPL